LEPFFFHHCPRASDCNPHCKGTNKKRKPQISLRL